LRQIDDAMETSPRAVAATAARRTTRSGQIGETPMPSRRPWYSVLYVQVLIAIALGVLVGWLLPDVAKNEWVEFLGKAFVKLIKMAIAPIIFCTIVSGISHIEEAKSVGRVGVKALVYFEAVSTLALIIGLAVGLLWQPGANFPVKEPSAADLAQVTCYKEAAQKTTPTEYILHIIPDSVVGAFVSSPDPGLCKPGAPTIFPIGDILQVLFFAVLFGFALMRLGQRGHALRELIDDAAHAMFGIIAIIMKVAPIGAFGAMAFTIGKFGPAALGNLLNLVLTFYVASALFVFVVLGAIARVAGFSIFRFVRYIKDELLIVLGTSSSESALPTLMEKLERLGCSKQVVGLVVPTGYSFNLDGTNIYMTLATLFIAQALHVDLSLGQMLTILLVAMLTSKGASGVTGAGFVVLAGTLASADVRLLPGLAIVFGIDKFMSEVRALTNITGNGVATVVVSWWEGELDLDKLRRGLAVQVDPASVAVAERTG
jgi:aerobic C4-dicarboxylate transport protein